MLYHLFTFLEQKINLPGAGLFQFISFRTAMAVLFSLVISLIFGKRIIKYLKSKQIGETVRDLGLKGESRKEGTPTMGGIIILMAIFLPTLLFANLNNIYVILALGSTIWLGLIGYIDDYIKVFRKDKKGLAGTFKLIGQVGLGIIVGFTMYFHDDIVIRNTETNKGKKETVKEQVQPPGEKSGKYIYEHQSPSTDNRQNEQKSTKTTIPFFKGNELDYAKILAFLGEGYEKWAWLIYIPIVIFIITAVSNGSNLTDGLDGLAAGVSAVIILTLAVFAYVSGNTIFSNYLGIMYIPNLSELVIFSGAMVGACIGFLWYNAFPAQVFMGDTGSLSLGGLIAVLAVMVRKELLIPLLCGIFLVESLSVILQVTYFKYTRRKYGEGKRIFKMSPLHHHYQILGYSEAKIVTRFWIVAISLAILTIITLKIR